MEIKPGVDLVKVPQYPVPLEAKKDITPHVRQLLDLGVLQPMQLAWNMPLLSIKKSHTNDYRPLQGCEIALCIL